MKKNLRLLFVNLSLRPDSKRRQLPVGLGYIMTAVKKAGFEFELLDMDIDMMSVEDFEAALPRKAHDIYLMGCIVTGYRLVKRLSAAIKKAHPEALVVAGNSVATSIPDLLLRDTQVDVAVLGEGDDTIIALLEAASRGAALEDVPGIALRKDGRVVRTSKRPVISSLDGIGFPEWELFDLKKYDAYGTVNANTFSGEKTLCYPLNSARGCPYSCTFCYHVFRGERYRRYSDDAIIAEIRRLHDRYGCNFISFWDELAFPTVKSLSSFVERLGRLPFKVRWEAPTRGDLLRREHLDLVKALKETGCENLAFSLENADEGILKAMNKKMSVASFIEQAQTLWDGGVVPLTSVVFGYPQETPASIQATIDVCERCRIYPSVGFLLPLPGTPIYEWARENGRIPDEAAYLERIGDRQDFHINLTRMSDQDFVGTVETGLRGLAAKLGLKLDSVFKTVTYQKPKDVLGA